MSAETELELCPFCHEDKDGYTRAFGAFYLLWDRWDGWCLHAGKCKPKPIKFCPMCGDDLRRRKVNARRKSD